jgi:cytochrome c oxidase subunit 2
VKSKLSVVAFVAGIACLGAALIYSSALLYARVTRKPDLRIRAVAHQWWWEFDYPSLGVRTSNVLYLPSTRNVRLDLSSADVIHSFWVLGMKDSINLIPGKTQSVDLELTSAGELYGNCDSGCGCGTVCMRFRVLARPPAQFLQWAAGQRIRPTEFTPPQRVAAPACATDPSRDHRGGAGSPHTNLQRLLDRG